MIVANDVSYHNGCRERFTVTVTVGKLYYYNACHEDFPINVVSKKVSSHCSCGKSFQACDTILQVYNSNEYVNNNDSDH